MDLIRFLYGVGGLLIAIAIAMKLQCGPKTKLFWLNVLILIFFGTVGTVSLITAFTSPISSCSTGKLFV